MFTPEGRINGALVEDDLELESKLLDDLEGALFVRFACRHNRGANAQWLDSTTGEFRDERLRWWRPQSACLAAIGVVQDGAVFRYDHVEYVQKPFH